MAAPDHPTVELLLNGAWVDISDYVYQRDKISVKRGRADEAGQVDPSTCTFTVNNIDGRFSPRNPLGPYYGQIGRNTQVRVAVWRNGAQYFRFYGEVSAWPVQWDLSGNDVYVQVTASGIQRRLSQRNSPLKSAVYRDMTSRVKAVSSVVAYWPMEDAAGALAAASGLSGGPVMKMSGSATFAAFSGWYGSDPLPKMDTATFSTVVPNYTVTGETSIRFFCNVNTAVPATYQELIRYSTTGTAKTWWVSLKSDGSLRFIAKDTDGVALFDSTDVTWTGLNTRGMVMLTLETKQVGANFTWNLLMTPFTNGMMQSDLFYVYTVASGTASGSTVGRITNVTLGTNGNLGDVNIGHLSVATAINAYADSGSSMSAWNDDGGAQRFARLCGEEGIPNVAQASTVWNDNTVGMGSQHSATVIDLLRQIPETDLGMIYEPRDQFALGYRTRLSLYNQAPTLTLDYAAQAVAGDLNPVDDDQSVLNSATVSRTDGSSAHVELTDGPLSTQAPPDGVGRYDAQITLSVSSDDQLADQAGWRVFLGTVDEPRYPAVTLQLSSDPFTSNPAQMAAALNLDVGDRLDVVNAPAWLPPGDIRLMVQGYSETFDPFLHSITLNCTPESPWEIGVLDDPASRLDTDGSQLAASATASAATLSVATTAGPMWTTNAADWPLDVAVGGEQITVTAVGQVLNGNPSFEAGVAGWTPFGGATIAPSTAQAQSGKQSCLLTTGGAASPRAEANKAPVTAGQQYRAVGWVFAASTFTTTVGISVNWYDATNAFLSTSSNATVPTAGRWEPRDTIYTAPAGATQAGIFLSCQGTPAAGLQLYADEIRLIPVTSYVSSPQTFTVTRGVNGITKAQTAGTDVRLADPAIISL